MSGCGNVRRSVAYCSLEEQRVRGGANGNAPGDHAGVPRPAGGALSPADTCTFRLASQRSRMERSADWMDQARGDLEHARHDLSAGFHDWACFSAQQAAEKAAKAVLQKLAVEAWGHSVADLLDEIARSRGVPGDLRDAGLELDKAYIPARYPNAHPSGSPRSRYTKGEAERMISHAERILQCCRDLLSAI